MHLRAPCRSRKSTFSSEAVVLFLANEEATQIVARGSLGLDADEAGSIFLYTMDSELYPTDLTVQTTVAWLFFYFFFRCHPLLMRRRVSHRYGRSSLTPTAREQPRTAVGGGRAAACGRAAARAPRPRASLSLNLPLPLMVVACS